MGEAAYIPAVGPRGHVINGQVHPVTGFIENPGFTFDFDSKRKVMWLEEFRRSGLRLIRTCDAVGVSRNTVATHLKNDPAFEKAYEDVIDRYKEDLECNQMDFALDKKCFMDRAMQLRRLMPEKYDNTKTPKQEIILNLSVNGASEFVKSAKIIDVETDKALVNGLANDDLSDGRP